MQCHNKVALVAGGGSGIGRATALVFAGQGAKVVVADRSKSGADETVSQIEAAGGSAFAVAFDITNLDSCFRVVQATLDRFGVLDHAVSTVGWSDTTFFFEETKEYWDKIIEINLLGSIYFSRACLNHMQSRNVGSIVLTSSDAGKVGTLGETVYAAAKAGVIGFVKSLAREISKYELRVNAISPGPTDTPLLRAQSHQDVIDRMVKFVPLKRIGLPIEQANAIVFLASDAASYITGQTLSVSGGLTMTS